jgi:RNA recognition motif-containing protein
MVVPAGVPIRANTNSINIDISHDRFTNRNPSFCFVDLDTADTAASAMTTLTGKMLLGRRLKVKPCIQKRDDIKTQQSPALVSSRWNSTSSAPKPTTLLLPQNEQRRLVISGLRKPVNDHASDREIRALFKNLPSKPCPE